MNKRVLSLFMILSLVLTAAPVSVSRAEKNTDAEISVDAEFVIEDGLVVDEEPPVETDAAGGSMEEVVTDSVQDEEIADEVIISEGVIEDEKIIEDGIHYDDNGNIVLDDDIEETLLEEIVISSEEETSGPGWDHYSLFSEPLLKDGSYVDWIDRIDFDYLKYGDDVRKLYDILSEGADGDGIKDYLIDDKYYQKESVDEVIYTKSDNHDYNEILILNKSYSTEQEANELMSGLKTAGGDYRRILRATYDAFDRDRPEVFWLSGSTRTRITHTAGTLSNGESRHFVRYYFGLRDVVNDDPNSSSSFDIRRTGYRDMSAVTNDIERRDTAVSGILDEPAVKNAPTTVGKIEGFNSWLVDNNEYNTSGSGNFPAMSRESITALMGNTGTEGPVCEGYARAFKVLCDRVGIPCVLVDGTVTGGAHMWNYVEVEGSWYAVDVTWNDAGGVKGKWLLVGRDTQIDGKAFIESHPPTNIASSEKDGSTTIPGLSFLNGPQLNYNALSECYSISDENVDVVFTKTEHTYTGSSIEPEPDSVTLTMSDGKKKELEKDIDYSLSWEDNIEIGKNTAKLVVSGKGNYTGQIRLSFTILPSSLRIAAEKGKRTYYCGDTLNVDDITVTLYNEHKIGTTVTSQAKIDISRVDMSYSGKKYITVTYTLASGTVLEDTIEIEVLYRPYTIPPEEESELESLKNCYFSVISDKTYNGKAFMPTPKLTYIDPDTQKKKTLVNGTDYVLSYQKNTDAGTATVTATAIGNYYRDSVSTTFTIKKKKFSSLTFVASSVKKDDKAARPIKVYDGGRLLYDETAPVEYANSGDVKAVKPEFRYKTIPDLSRKGTVKYVLTADEDSNYTGDKTVSCTCVDPGTKTMLSDLDAAGLIDIGTYDKQYSGSAKKPTFTIKASADGSVVLVKGQDYSVSYSKNINAGQAYAVITGKKNYTGKVIKTFEIEPRKVDFTVIVNSNKNMTYTGKALKPSVKVTVPKPTNAAKIIKLTKDKDYTIQYHDNINAGKGYVTIRGIGNYKGVDTGYFLGDPSELITGAQPMDAIPFVILPRSIKKASKSRAADGTIVLKYGGKKLKIGVDYLIDDPAPGSIKGIKNFTDIR